MSRIVPLSVNRHHKIMVDTTWTKFEIEKKIIRILAEIPTFERARHFGRPFLTSYQIAIVFSHRYPDDFRHLGLPIGGEKGSLAQFIAQHLSVAVRENHPHLEGGVLSYQHLEDMTLDNDGDIIRPSRFPVAMFRYVD